jgi:hypothetical protein
MRPSVFILAALLALPASASAQTAKRTRDVERFDVAGLPKTPGTELEREILLLLRVHKKGDLADATRIHAKLAEYYKQRGDSARADDCSRMATDAWDVISGAERTTAHSPGKPPFSPEGKFQGTFTYTDELKVTQTWEFFSDGTFARAVNDATHGGGGPSEVGWYTLRDGRMRLWQVRPSVDRTVTFELLGDGGKDGAVLDGVRMKPGA